MKLVFATSNENKLREAREILQREIRRVDVDIPEIQALHVKDVVEDKARKAYEIVKKPVIVEDTGLYIKAWNDFPGALVRWMLKAVGVEGMCSMLGDERSAYAETCVCLYDDKGSHIFSGRIDGMIANKPRGDAGFGWDPVFQPKGYRKTFAEMSAEEKNSISMRREAFAKMSYHIKAPVQKTKVIQKDTLPQ